MLLLSYIVVLHSSSWTKNIVLSFLEIADFLAWAVVKDWTVVEVGQRGFNTPSKTPIAEGGNTPRKRQRMQSESPTPMSLKEPDASDIAEVKEFDGSVFEVIFVYIESINCRQRLTVNQSQGEGTSSVLVVPRS